MSPGRPSSPMQMPNLRSNRWPKINKHDANTVEDIIERYTNRWRAAFGKYRYHRARRSGADKDPLEELFDDPKYGIDPKYATMTVGEIATDLFESPEVQTFYMRAMQTSNGLFPCDQARALLSHSCPGSCLFHGRRCDRYRGNPLHNPCPAPRL